MKLDKLCAKRSVLAVSRDPGDLMIFGATEDLNEVGFGFLFCAASVPGDGVTGGLKYCQAAVDRGAVAVAVPYGTSLQQLALSEYDQVKTVIIWVSNPLTFVAEAIGALHPLRPDFIAGITGTNGKTSTVSFIENIWTHLGRSAASLGTLGLRSGQRQLSSYDGMSTTYNAQTTHAILEQLHRHLGVTHLALEATARGLHQQRLSGILFDVAGYTNLTHDHLDYHGDMPTYAMRKATLFRDRLKPGGTAVLNMDDRACSDLIVNRGQYSLLGYSMRREAAAEIKLVSHKVYADCQTGILEILGKRFEIRIPIVGKFQLPNILCAIGIVLASGCETESIVDALHSLQQVPGRMELVGTSRFGAPIFVDFAHTDDGLDQVLRSALDHVCEGGKLAVVFGCCGGRDQSKRPKMGAVASKHAARVYITDDSPLFEDPQTIRRQILEGVGSGGYEIADRRAAIEMAVEELRAGDVLVVAGKGSEDCQLKVDAKSGSENDVKLLKVPFDDAQVIQSIAHVSCSRGGRSDHSS